ncbi:unnamed protein product [Tilletia controversa]|uniref:Small ribosomal subunit protein uS10m n=3 Tax=Tilletia TaxID=13289 RepID=A0A8X7N009_9BASI|nr:hypothetical protein CF335_g7619 [Tilletia laevis]KAE8205365.1 hypothetical protein CF328_g543 [Tilletia controversa]KAE8256919.1 hypothetical protein A4X03_0g4926 [Tilletia caries]KAE8189893.1 hypothetical protein CF336_g5540 [Tilletia laevis]KAE8255173.1 hypothetical protein A4X06_0g556 [Tilletia controversa]
MNVSRTALSLVRRSAVSQSAAARSCAGPSRWVSSSALRTQAQEVATSESSDLSRLSASSGQAPPPPPSTSTGHDAIPSTARGAGKAQEVQQAKRDEFVPPPIPQTFEELRYFKPPESAPLTHGVHVATLSLWTYGPTLHNLENFSTFALRVMGALGIPHSGIARLPTKTSLWTVPKSPFVHKKAQENFERRTHRRAIKLWDANPEVVDRCLAFLREHPMAEVHMKAQLFRYIDLPSTPKPEETKAATTTAATSTPSPALAAPSDSGTSPTSDSDKP